MDRKTALILMILIVTTIPGVLAETLTVSIPDSESDVWMTEAGNVFGYESSVHILDGSIGLRAFLRFEDVAIAKSDKIDLATLYVYAGWDQGGSPDPGASATIYGIAEPDCSPFSYSGRVWSLERPLTSASVNWDLSTWPYAGWKSVNVTDIVKEIVNRYAWEENNSLGFQILGASDSGQEVRTFEDIDHQHSGNYAYLYIQYNLPPGVPPGLPPGATYEETYQDWEIWENVIYYDASMSIYTDDYDLTAEYYHTTFSRGTANGSDMDHILSTGDIRTTYGYADLIARVGDTIICMIDTGQVHLFYSHDEGATWGDMILNDQYTDLASHSTSSIGSMSVDVNGTVHVTWGTYTDTSPGAQVSVLSNFTVDEAQTFHFYDGFKEWTFNMGYENIEADRYGRLHIGFVESTNIKYVMRFINGTWYGPQTIETLDSLTEVNVDVADQSGDFPWVRFVYWRAWAGVDDIYQTIRAPDGTLADTLLDSDNCFRPSSAMDMDGNVSWAIWTDIPEGVTPRIVLRGYDFTTTSLLAQQWVSSTVQQHGPGSDIGIGGDGYGYIVWYTPWFTDHYGRRFDLNGTLVGSQEQVIFWPSQRDAVQIVPWADAEYGYSDYFLVDENGTIIDTWTLAPDGLNFTDIEDLKDFVDDIINPQGGDPLDPAPGSGWEETGPFTRFRMRLYFMIIGVACIFVPIWAISYKRPGPQGVAWCCMLILIGLGLLISIPNI